MRTTTCIWGVNNVAGTHELYKYPYFVKHKNDIHFIFKYVHIFVYYKYHACLTVMRDQVPGIDRDTRMPNNMTNISLYAIKND